MKCCPNCLKQDLNLRVIKASAAIAWHLEGTAMYKWSQDNVGKLSEQEKPCPGLNIRVPAWSNTSVFQLCPNAFPLQM